MLSYPSGMTVSSRALIMLTDALRGRRAAIGTRWRRLAVVETIFVAVYRFDAGFNLATSLRKRSVSRNNFSATAV